MPARGGLVIGGLAGIFYGVQLVSSIARAKRNYKDTMAAGLATGMVFGIARARCAVAPCGYHRTKSCLPRVPMTIPHSVNQLTRRLSAAA